MRVAVIGGGPSGLVTLKYLLQAHPQLGIEPIEAVLFEAEAKVGGTFRYRSYEDAELTLFSDFRLPDNEPDFLSTKKYCEYMEEYCTNFELWPHIRTSTCVKNVRSRIKGGHTIHYKDLTLDVDGEWHCDALAICSGLHVTPNIPAIPGIDRVPRTMHSTQFKKREHFGIDQNVMILGAGETAMDLAYLAVTSPTRRVVLCHRNGWQNAPKRLPDPVRRGDIDGWRETQRRFGPMPPSDCGNPSLFDTAYVHPWLEKSGLLWSYYDLFTKASAWLLSGTTAGLDQWVGGLSETRHHASKVIPNKSNNAMPYISLPYRPKVQTKGEWKRSQRLSLPPADLNGRHIDLAPWPESINERGYVTFRDTGRPESDRMKQEEFKPDVVVFATGYTQVFPFLVETYPTPDEADFRRIWKTEQPDVGFIGFVRPNFGAIPPLAELQAQLWILNLVGGLQMSCTGEVSYRLKVDADRRIQYAVDHDSYAYQLALDMNCAPSILQVATFGPKTFGAWALGPNFNTKFRLIGKWNFDDAPQIMAGELWRVIARRRGWFVWTFLTILPMCIFGPLSFAMLFVNTCLVAISWIWGHLLRHSSWRWMERT